MNIFLTVREYKGSHMLEISGAVYGKIIGSNIHEICYKLSRSNVIPNDECTVYIDESGYGKEVAEELDYFFKIHTVKYKPKPFCTKG